MKMFSFFKNRYDLLFSALIVVFVILRFTSLATLPIFADEAIYIRWAQLIIDDWQQYLFFPLNDGKTPLFIWLLVPAQFLFSDQLIAGRIVSLLSGVITMYGAYRVVSAHSHDRLTPVVASFLVGFTPFWFFHHGMALMDSLLTLFLLVTLLHWLDFIDSVPFTKKILLRDWSRDLLYSPQKLSKLLVVGVCFASALLVKIPAILFVPTLVIVFFLRARRSHEFIQLGFYLCCSMTCAVGIFLLQKLHPAFGQLFSRGSDFLFPVGSVLFDGQWKHTLSNIPTYIGYFWFYLTPGVMTLAVLGLFSRKHKKYIHLFFWSAVSFCLPIILLGRVVYPRYLLPASIGFTFAAVFAFEGFVYDFVYSSVSLKKQILAAVALSFLGASIVTQSLQFVLAHYVSDAAIPFVSSDKEQYQTEWSSGHGIKEFAQTLTSRSKDTRVAVATEGTFGTLPDGLLAYFHGEDVSNIYIEGIGYPVKSIPDVFVKKAQGFEEVYLLVNEHRLQFELPQELLVAQYCRPFNAPCLQVWDITSIVSDI